MGLLMNALLYLIQSKAEKRIKLTQQSLPENSAMENPPAQFDYISLTREYDGYEDNMTMHLYQIKAKWPETNRQRTITITALNEDSAKSQLFNLGFQEPITMLKRINYEPATERQIAFMIDEKMFIPQHFCKEDASAIISNFVSHDRPYNMGLAQFAISKGINFSYYVGKKRLYSIVWYSLSLEDKIAFFIFCIYRYYSDDREANLLNSQYKELFYKFAQLNITDESFVQSMETNYRGSDLRFFGTLVVGYNEYSGGSTATKSFRTAMSYLKDTLNIEYFPKKVLR